MKHNELTLSSGLRTFVRMRASLKDEPVAVYWSGSMYHSVKPSEATEDYPPTGGSHPPTRPLMKIVGFNIGRAYYDRDIPLAGGQLGHGYYFLGKELQLYMDPTTEALLDRWENPLIPRNADGTGGRVTKSISVLHMANSPVCWVWAEPYERPEIGFSPFAAASLSDALAYDELGPMTVHRIELFGKERSILDTPDGRYARFSAGPVHQFEEIIQFFGKRDELADASVSNAQDVAVSWTRNGPYWPWMHMGRAPGGILISAAGFKVPGAFQGLPSALKRIVLERFPEFAEPIRGKYNAAYQKFEDSWSYFKRELDSGRYVPTAIP